MRIVKDAEERRSEILDAADRLFGEKGFDGTSTNDILDAVGIARGTLYYHFASKEEIMDALIDRHSTRLFRAAKEAAADASVPVVERIIRTIMAVNMGEGSGKEIIDHIHKPQNALMHQKTKRAILEGLTPVLAGIIADGVAAGLFDTPYPYECMELVVAYINAVFDEEEERMSDGERESRMRAFIFNMERILGAEKGCLAPIMNAFGGGNAPRRG